MNADAIVRARVPAETKDRAIEALDRMGLTLSDLIRITLTRVAAEGRLPFAVAVPNATTRAAAAELESGKGKKHTSAATLMKDLGI